MTGDTTPEPSPPELRIRVGGADDATGAAVLHAGQIAEGFLPSLGPRFLRRLYRRIALDPQSFLLVAGGTRATAGFIAGSVDVGSLYRSFALHDGLVAGAVALPRLVRGWRPALETQRHGVAGPAGAELLAVAVDPAWQGRGVGRRLVDAFLDELRRRGVGEANVVVAATNGTAQSLYRSAGFRLEQEFELHPGTTSLLMHWTAP